MRKKKGEGDLQNRGCTKQEFLRKQDSQEPTFLFLGDKIGMLAAFTVDLEKGKRRVRRPSST